MLVVIDGNNVMGHSGWEEGFLCRQVGRWSQKGSHRGRLFFDGDRRGRHLNTSCGLLEICYSGREAADDLIMDFLKEQKQPLVWRLVTNDRQLVVRGRYQGVSQWRVDDFVRSVGKSVGGGGVLGSSGGAVGSFSKPSSEWEVGRLMEEMLSLKKKK